ncbi:Uncharacterized conserved protein, implicated in type VI secretion and phage assembly [Filimonas lacunae]|uniref:Uncharacterized conserved protein, implicated in type VI secretion and phage assembly n=1 Tax=Filimonas lacunae TaxID=477680 RepID=A0A173MF69_9BACT|nr:phage baseplate assembly protein V [Filimonas lacunae]BAV06252.1 type VI secretion protein Vgr [Filimonas lacunae]SIT25478.1 Uncharacterized conserved protein, implicated in type VI secretion and phage assembly [Filimonas lacunae]
MMTPQPQPSNDNTDALKQAAIQQGEQLAINEIEKKAGEKAQKAVDAAQKVQQAAGIAQTVASQLKKPATSPTGTSSVPAGTNAPQQTAAPADTDAGAGNTTAGTSDSSTQKSDELLIVSTVGLELTIEGHTLKNYESFTLHQSTSQHHRFELVVAYDAFDSKEQPVDDHWMKISRKLPGKAIFAGFYYKAKEGDNKKRYFSGVITNVSFRRSSEDAGFIVIAGYSPTILMDGAPHIQSFTGNNLVKIAEDIATQSGIKGFLVAKPKYTSNLIYSCQYNETHYNYLNRLAVSWGEWFYYSGEKLYFGKPELPPAVKLVFGRDVQQMETVINTAHVQPSHYGYSSTSHEALTSEAYDVKGLDDIGEVAFKASQTLYKTPAMQVSPVRASNSTDVKATQKSLTTAYAAGLFTVKGISTNPYLFPGCPVSLEVRDAKKQSNEHFADLIITDLKQTLLPNGEYQCEFIAIPSSSENLPHPAVIAPTAEPQLATVISNKDKDGQGRVTVQFHWQKDPTDLIRVMTPDAGNSDKVGANRGLVTIPEVGDQVMVGFIHSNPDRPFVMGSMFHGKVGTGGGDGNNMKSLTSKSGHTVQLNDAGSIIIRDKSNANHIEINGDNTITVTAAKTIELTNGKSSIKIDDETITIDAKNIVLTGDKITGTGDTSITLSTKEAAISGKDKVDVNGKEVTISASANATLSGNAKTVVTAVGQTCIEGAIVKLN